MRNRWLSVITGIILLLTLAGCATLEMSTIIWPDGSGTRRAIVTVDQRAYDLAELRGTDLFADLKLRAEEIGATIEPYERDGQVGVSMEVNFPDLDTLNLGLGTESFETVQVEKSRGLFKETLNFRAQIDTSQLPRPPRIELGDIQRFDFIYHVTLPGEIVSHNADEMADSRLTWYLDPLDESQTIYELTATAERDRQGLTTIALACGAGLLGLIILVGLIRVVFG